MRILWKSLPVALIALLIAGSVAAQETSTTEETPAPVPLTSAQRRAVRVFADDGILAGTSCSVQDCSGIAARWEVALWVVRNLDSEPTSHRAFADVDSEEPYAGYVQTMFDLGATVGCMVDPLRYCPNRETRRGQMAAFVTRAYDLDDTIPPHGFSDVPRSHPFRDNISALKNAGILSSDCAEGEGLFCPDDPIVAAEAVEWLYRASRLDTTESRSDGGGGGGGGGAGRGGGGRGGGGRGGGGGGGGGGNTGGGGGNGGGGGTTPTTPTSPPTTTTIVVSNSGPGGAEIDIGPDGECTHWDAHVRFGSNNERIGDGKSNVLLSDPITQNGRTLKAGYFAHRHDGSTTRWWYWSHADPDSEQVEGPIGLPTAELPIPCHHVCPTDHMHGANDGFEYSPGAHYFGEDSSRTRTYVYQQDGSWRQKDFPSEVIGGREGPCDHTEEHSH